MTSIAEVLMTHLVKQMARSLRVGGLNSMPDRLCYCCLETPKVYFANGLSDFQHFETKIKTI